MTRCGCPICRWHDAEVERCWAGVPWRGPTPTAEDYARWDAEADMQLERVLAHPAAARHDPRIPLDTVRAVWQRDRGRCQDCGEHHHLEAHHLTYAYLPGGRPDWQQPINGHETPDDLALLCRYCHHRRHIDPNGEYWADPEALAAHWAAYFDALEELCP